MDEQQHGLSCEAHGTAALQQSGNDFNGVATQEGYCAGPGGSADLSGTFPISQGRIGGTDIAFALSDCQASGSTIGSPPSGASGTLSCRIRQNGTTFKFTGTWQITRGAATLTLAPDSLGVVIDTTGRLQATLLDAAGVPLTDHQFRWISSDLQVASVDNDGTVHGLSPGTVTVRVASIPLYPLEDSVVKEVRVSVVLRFTAIRAGAEHTCAVTAKGRAFCWGWGADYRLGTGTQSAEMLPAAVAGSLRFATVSPGMVHSCGLTTSGAAYCWGNGVGGALGDGTGNTSPVPIAIASNLSFALVEAGTYGSCAVTASGDAYCWGTNDEGAVGRGSIGGPYQLSPFAVVGGHSFAQLSSTVSPGGGGVATCGVTTAGDGYCWGQGSVGQLGDSSEQASGSPMLIAGAHTWSSIQTGWGHTCGITTDSVAYCWGYAIDGALGTGSTQPVTQSVPALVSGGYHWSAISAGDHYTCGITTSGAAFCWGTGGSRLGSGQMNDQPAPTPVLGGLHFTAISAGGGHTCGLATSGPAYCWGDGSFGQLGHGTQMSKGEPTLVGRQ